VVIEQGTIGIVPDAFTQEDVESCFKFLLGKSSDITLSDSATLKKKKPVEGGGTTGCFIATAVYGYEAAPEVITLRDFRDNVLLSSKVGRAFVVLYYFFSPPVARLLNANLLLRNIVRKAVVQPIVNLVSSTFYTRQK